MGTTPQVDIPPIVKGLVREILSEPGPTGTGSASRVIMLLVTIAPIVWISIGVWKTGHLDMGQVEAALTFMTSGGFYYAVNRTTGGGTPKPVNKTVDKPPVA